MKKYILIFSLLLIGGCSNNEKDTEINKLKQEISVLKKELKTQKAPTVPKKNKYEHEYTREQVLEARKKYDIQVISFEDYLYGTTMKTNLVRLKITNNSEITLPTLTVYTKRWKNDKKIGGSRAPHIPTHNLKPGESAEFDYYALGGFEGIKIDKITVEIEQLITEIDEQFIKELPKI